MATNQPSEKVTEILGRALLDPDFSTKLFEDRDGALSGYELTDEDRETLNSIPRQNFDEHAKNFREGSVVGAAVAVGVGARGTFAPSE